MKNDIPEKIIDVESTCFGMLIKAHNMSHVRNNIYMDVDGAKWILTRYGLQPVDQYNKELIIEDLHRKIKKIDDERRKDIDRIEGQSKEIIRLTEKTVALGVIIQNSSSTSTPRSNKDKNEQIAILKGKLKMKNVEIDELKRAVARHKEPKLVKGTMPKIMISQMTKNIHAIITTPMPDCKKLEQIENLVSTHI